MVDRSEVTMGELNPYSTPYSTYNQNLDATLLAKGEAISFDGWVDSLVEYVTKNKMELPRLLVVSDEMYSKIPEEVITYAKQKRIIIIKQQEFDNRYA